MSTEYEQPGSPATGFPKGADRAKFVRVSNRDLLVELNDGRLLMADVDQFPRLRGATPAQLSDHTVIGPGFGIHWAALDEDLSIAGLLKSAALGATGVQFILPRPRVD